MGLVTQMGSALWMEVAKEKMMDLAETLEKLASQAKGSKMDLLGKMVVDKDHKTVQESLGVEEAKARVKE